MCIILDTNCWNSIFQPTSIGYKEFKPVWDWITLGNGKIVYGGSKYMAELGKAPKYMKIFKLLKDRGRVIRLKDEDVDKEQERIGKIITDPDFDDPHLPAIVIVGKCLLICSADKRSIKFVKKSFLYPKGWKIPKYYMGERNKKLLCDKYIDKSHLPVAKLNKETYDMLSKSISISIK